MQSPKVLNIVRACSPQVEDENVVDEYLLESLSDWRNVQDIVRLTFKALSDVIKNQGIEIRDLQEQIQNLSSVDINTIYSTTLENKNEIIEINQRIEQTVFQQDINEIYQRLDQTVSRKDHHYLKQQMDDHGMNLENKTNRSEIDQVLRSQQKLLDGMHQELGRVTSGLAEKADSKEIEAQLKLKANKQSVANAFHQKANKAELEGLRDSFVKRDEADQSSAQSIDIVLKSVSGLKSEQEVRIADLESDIKRIKNEAESIYTITKQAMNDKADKLDVDYLKQLLQRKPDVENINKLVDNIKQGNRNLQDSESVKILEAKVGKMATDMVDYRNTLEELALFRNNVFEDVKNYIGQQNMTMKSQIMKESSQQKDADAAKLLSIDLNETKSYVRSALTTSQADMSQRLITLGEEMRALETRIDNSLSQKISNGVIGKLEPIITKLDKYDYLLTEIEKLKGNMLSKEILHELQEEQASYAEAETTQHTQNLNDFKAELTKQLQNVIHRKDFDEVDVRIKNLSYDFHDAMKNMQSQIEIAMQDVQSKVGVHEMRGMIDFKTRIDDISSFIMDWQETVKNSITLKEFNIYKNEQAIINDVLCTENCAARFIWRCGQLIDNLYIPWDTISVNTCPDNFLCENDFVNVLWQTPGLYEISLGFFTSVLPKFVCIVNGEPVMLGLGPLKNEIPKHSAGNITGYSVYDIVSLPQRALISIQYAGSTDCEGFISLRKLQINKTQMEELLLSAEADLAHAQEQIKLYFGKKKREPFAKIMSFVLLCFQDMAPHSSQIQGLSVHLNETEAGLSRVGLLGGIINSALEKEHGVDLQAIEEAYDSIYDLPAQTGILGVVDFPKVYDDILKVMTIFLKSVLNRLPNFHFKLIVITSKLIKASEGHYSRPLLQLLTRLLERFGDYFADSLQKTTTMVVKSLIGHLEALNLTHPLHLQSASKLRNRKVGNSHQTRRKKNLIKRSENTKLKLLNKESLNSNIDQKLVKAELRYVSAILVTNPDYSIELSNFFRLGGLNDVLQEAYLTAALHYAIFDRTQISQFKQLLRDTKTDPGFVRHLSFIISNY